MCDTPVDISETNQIIQCSNCKTNLLVPEKPNCPECGEADTQLVSPEEQVNKIDSGSEGKLGGAAMAGPVGMIVGARIDEVNKKISEEVRNVKVYLKSPLFTCNECQAKWAFKLPQADAK